MRREELTLAELAESSGVPARTIRFYIARGLLDGPVRSGRGAAYHTGHLDRLQEIRKLQASGLMLAEIARQMGDGREREAPEPAAFWQYTVADDVTVSVRADASPWRLRAIRAAVADMAARLKTPERSE